MSWSSGSYVLSGIYDVIKANVTDRDARIRIYTELIDIFRDSDWDNLDEFVGLDDEFDEAIVSYNPSLEEWVNELKQTDEDED